MTGRTVTACFAITEKISHALERANGGRERESEGFEAEKDDDDEIPIASNRLQGVGGNLNAQVMEEAPITVLVHKLIEHALGCRAMDIHLEPLERELRVRYRVDGCSLGSTILRSACKRQ